MGRQLHTLRAPDCLQHAIRTLCFISHWYRALLHLHGGQKGEGSQAQALAVLLLGTGMGPTYRRSQQFPWKN